MIDDIEERVDVCQTCLSMKAPQLPLREEILTQGFETVLLRSPERIKKTEVSRNKRDNRVNKKDLRKSRNESSQSNIREKYDKKMSDVEWAKLLRRRQRRWKSAVTYEKYINPEEASLASRSVHNTISTTSISEGDCTFDSIVGLEIQKRNDSDSRKSASQSGAKQRSNSWSDSLDEGLSRIGLKPIQSAEMEPNLSSEIQPSQSANMDEDEDEDDEINTEVNGDKDDDTDTEVNHDEDDDTNTEVNHDEDNDDDDDDTKADVKPDESDDAYPSNEISPNLMIESHENLEFQTVDSYEDEDNGAKTESTKCYPKTHSKPSEADAKVERSSQTNPNQANNIVADHASQKGDDETLVDCTTTMLNIFDDACFGILSATGNNADALYTLNLQNHLKQQDLSKDQMNKRRMFGMDEDTTPSHIVAICGRGFSSPSELQMALEDDPLMAKVIDRDGRLPLHAVCAKGMAMQSLPRLLLKKLYNLRQGCSNMSRSSACSQGAELSLDNTADVEGEAQYGRSVQEYLDNSIQNIKEEAFCLKEIIEIILNANEEAAIMVDRKGDLPIHLLGRQLWEWEKHFKENYLSRYARKQGQNTIIRSKHHKKLKALFKEVNLIHRECIQCLIEPLCGNTTVCRTNGSKGTLLPLHIAALHGVKFDILNETIEAYKEGVSTICEGALTGLKPILPIDLLDRHKPREKDFPNEDSERSDAQIDALDAFNEASDLIFMHHPNVMPHRVDQGRIHRIEAYIKQYANDNAFETLPLEIYTVWTWMNTFQSAMATNDEDCGHYSESVNKIVRELDEVALAKLIHLNNSEAEYINLHKIAIPPCAEIIQSCLNHLYVQQLNNFEEKTKTLFEQKQASPRSTQNLATNERIDPLIAYLCRFIFGITNKEDCIPTSFIILPYKLKHNDDGGLELASKEDAEIALKFAESLLEINNAEIINHTLQKLIYGDSCEQGKDELWLKCQIKLERSTKALLKTYSRGKGYMYLLDEYRGVPVVSDNYSDPKRETYPFEILDPVETVQKILPLMQIGMSLMRGDRGLAILANIILKRSMNVIPEKLMEQLQGVVDKVNSLHTINVTNVNKYEFDTESTERSPRHDLLHFAMLLYLNPLDERTHVNSKIWDKEMSILNNLYDKFDMRCFYAGLKPVKNNLGMILWTQLDIDSDVTSFCFSDASITSKSVQILTDALGTRKLQEDEVSQNIGTKEITDEKIELNEVSNKKETGCNDGAQTKPITNMRTDESDELELCNNPEEVPSRKSPNVNDSSLEKPSQPCMMEKISHEQEETHSEDRSVESGFPNPVHWRKDDASDFSNVTGLTDWNLKISADMTSHEAADEFSLWSYQTPEVEDDLTKTDRDHDVLFSGEVLPSVQERLTFEGDDSSTAVESSQVKVVPINSSEGNVIDRSSTAISEHESNVSLVNSQTEGAISVESATYDKCVIVDNACAKSVQSKQTQGAIHGACLEDNSTAHLSQESNEDDIIAPDKSLVLIAGINEVIPPTETKMTRSESTEGVELESENMNQHLINKDEGESNQVHHGPIAPPIERNQLYKNENNSGECDDIETVEESVQSLTGKVSDGSRGDNELMNWQSESNSATKKGNANVLFNKSTKNGSSEGNGDELHRRGSYTSVDEENCGEFSVDTSIFLNEKDILEKYASTEVLMLHLSKTEEELDKTNSVCSHQDTSVISIESQYFKQRNNELVDQFCETNKPSDDLNDTHERKLNEERDLVNNLSLKASAEVLQAKEILLERKNTQIKELQQALTVFDEEEKILLEEKEQLISFLEGELDYSVSTEDFRCGRKMGPPNVSDKERVLRKESICEEVQAGLMVRIYELEEKLMLKDKQINSLQSAMRDRVVNLHGEKDMHIVQLLTNLSDREDELQYYEQALEKYFTEY